MARLLSAGAAPWIGLLTIIALAAIVELLLRAGILNVYVMPLPSDVLGSLGRVFAEENIPARFATTAGETLAAGLLVVLVGLPWALALHHWPTLRAAFEPWVAGLAAAPLVLAYPLFLVLFGRSPLTIVVIGFASGLAPLVLKAVEGFAATRRVLLDVGRSLRLSRAQEFRMILLPSALTQLFVGLRLALIFCLINVVGVEFLINFGGLGQLINDLAERYDLAGTYAAIVYVVLVSVLFFTAMDRCERWLRRRA